MPLRVQREFRRSLTPTLPPRRNRLAGWKASPHADPSQILLRAANRPVRAVGVPHGFLSEHADAVRADGLDDPAVAAGDGRWLLGPSAR